MSSSVVKGRKIVLVLITLTLCALIFATFFYYSLAQYRVLTENDSRISSLPFDADNFKIDNGLNISIPEDTRSYCSYKVINSSFSNESANDTVKAFFGDIIDNRTKFYEQEKWYVYNINSSANVMLYKYGKISYSVLGKTEIYANSEIIENLTLYNITETKQMALDYIEKKLGNRSADFFLRGSSLNSVVNSGINYTESYNHNFYRIINGIPCADRMAGRIEVSISPNGTITNFSYYHPLLTLYQNRSSPDLKEILKKVDDNFSYYRQYLFSGYVEFVLVNYHKSYGFNGDVLEIGWELTFLCGNEDNVIDTIFIS